MSYGIHIAKSSKIHSNKTYKSILDGIICEADELEMSAVQIFTHGPKNMNKNNLDYKKISDYCTEQKIDIYVHGPYASTGIWNITKDNYKTKKSQTQIKLLLDMLKSCSELNAKGLVIHLPKKTPDIIADVLQLLSHFKNIKLLQEKFKKKGPYILLEMPASKPDSKTYETPEKLNILCNMIKERNIKLKWGLCIDTAHQWSCGIEFNKLDAWESYLSNLDKNTKSLIKLIHLNGSGLKNFNTGKDVHEIVMSPYDAIWHDLLSDELKRYLDEKKNIILDEHINLFTDLSVSELNKIRISSLGSIINFVKKQNIAVICEINRGEFIYSKFALNIINGLL